MIDIDLLKYQGNLSISDVNGQKFIFDFTRKKYVVLLPEEFVRQIFIYYLTLELHYPKSRINVEKGVELLGKKGRFDIVIYDKFVNPWMLIECKNFHTTINQLTINQLQFYNQILKAPYHIVTNGIELLSYRWNENAKQYLQCFTMPKYPD